MFKSRLRGQNVPAVSNDRVRRARPGAFLRRRLVRWNHRDATVETAAVDRLRERERLYAEAERIAELGSWRFDVRANRALWSEGLFRIFGLEPAEQGLTFEEFLERVHPDDRERVESAARLKLQEGGRTTGDYRIIRPTGEVRAVHTEGEVTLDEAGEPMLTVGTMQDVTAQVDADRALARAQARYRSLVERIPLVTYVDRLDSNSTSIFVSPQVEEMLGYAAEEWADPELFRRILHPDDVDLVPKHDSLRVGDMRSVEYRVFAKDGRVLWVRDEFVVVQDDPGEEPHLEGFLADVTDRKLAEERIRESEERFRAMLESAAVGIILVDAERRILVSNHSFERMLGYSKEELAGIPLSAITHDEDEVASEEKIVSLRSGAEGTTFEKRYVDKQGEPVWARISPTPVRDRSGALEYVIAVVEDLRERRQLEEELRHAQKMEAVGRLAGGVAHDFNNLLLAIRGYCELADADAELSVTDTRRDIEQIKLASETAASLTGQLLAFSRKQVLKPEPVDLNTLISARLDLLERLVSERIALKAELAAGLDRARIDQQHMEQALANLILNARDAIEAEGAISIRTENVTVNGGRDDPAIPAGSYVRLSILDTGCGMDETTAARAFDPFFTTKGSAGTGLGLSTVHGFVEQSDGHVFIQSAPGDGTTIELYFPAVQDPVPAVERPEPGGGATEGSETILLVEDDDTVRKVLHRTLLRYGYRVLVAADGEDALALAGSYDGPIQAVVTDVIMPRMGGVELVRGLRTARPKAKVIYMSGHLQDQATLAQVQEHGEFLQKPFAPTVLARKVRELLDGDSVQFAPQAG
jgi:two-component system cell cycle sensor histidine kinase/response regulator CckA